MFTGQANVALDGKNRLLVPSKVREQMAAFGGDTNVVYLTKGHDGCLMLFPGEIFEKMARSYASRLQYEEPTERSVRRVFFGEAEKVTLDRQGRVLIPERLKGAAGLERELTLVGVFDRLEIWHRTVWEQYAQTSEAEYDENARAVLSGRRNENRRDASTDDAGTREIGG